MFVHDASMRVLYADTDNMGFVYYGNYPQYYEFGRTESIRHLGIAYKTLEEQGVAMPVIDLHCYYHKPAHYDDLLTIRTIIREMPAARIHFFYEIFNEGKDLLNTGETTLIFLNIERNRPVRAPADLLEKIKPYFE